MNFCVQYVIDFDNKAKKQKPPALLKGDKGQRIGDMGLIELMKSNFQQQSYFNVSGLPEKNVEHLAIENLWNTPFWKQNDVVESTWSA